MAGGGHVRRVGGGMARTGSRTYLCSINPFESEDTLGLFDRDNNTTTMDRQKAGAATMEAPTVSMPQPSMSRQTAPAPSPAPMQPARMTGRVAFKIRWTNKDGEVVCESMQVLSVTGSGMGEIKKPEGWPSGTYRVEFLVNDISAAMMDFDVR